MSNLERIPDVPTFIKDPDIRKYLLDLTRILNTNLITLNNDKVEDFEVQQLIGSNLIAGGTLTVTYNTTTRKTTVSN